VRDVIDALVAQYFKPRKLMDRIEQRAFVAVPSSGAGFTALA